MRFGEFVRELRTRKRFKLREFCEQFGHDASNWSKLERGDLPPSENPDTLKEYAKQLGLKQGSDDWYRFFDLAAQEKGKIPADILANKNLASALPIFFRTIRGQKPTEEEMDRLIEIIKRS